MSQTGHTPMLDRIENVNGTAALAFVGATMAGWSINEWAAFAALCYSLILIAGKLWQGIKWLRARKSSAD